MIFQLPSQTHHLVIQCTTSKIAALRTITLNFRRRSAASTFVFQLTIEKSMNIPHYKRRATCCIRLYVVSSVTSRTAF